MRQNLFSIAQAYACHEGITLTTLSNKIHGNHRFLERYLNDEVSTSIKTYYVMVNRLRQMWPKNLPWPKTRGILKLGKKVDDGFVDG